MQKKILKEKSRKEVLPKVSFLIAAHNEEKFIYSALKKLESLSYPNYEVIIGLDGCNDGTEEIVRTFVKKSKKFRYFSFNLRNGKPAVITEIIKKASGEVIVIHDSDWIFSPGSTENLKFYFSLFKNPKIGGIAESFPIEWDSSKIKSGNIGYKMVAYSTYYWMKYQKEKFAHRDGNLLYLSEPKMFLTNVFRKSLYEPDTTLGDDFERTINIMNKGYKIAVFDNTSFPRMVANYNKIPLIDLYRQKIRTAIARSQLKGKMEVGMGEYYIPSVFFMLWNSFRKRISIGLIVLLWVFVGAFATLSARFRKISTKEGWKIRIKRYNG